jgi:hypothetical protein
MERWVRNTTSAQTFASINHPQPESGNAVLREVFELLEDYAPTWYTEEHHNRLAAAIGELVSHSAIC